MTGGFPMKKRVYKTVLFLFLTATFLFAFSGCIISIIPLTSFWVK